MAKLLSFGAARKRHRVRSASANKIPFCGAIADDCCGIEASFAQRGMY
jgi:hypothetical protein